MLGTVVYTVRATHSTDEPSNSPSNDSKDQCEDDLERGNLQIIDFLIYLILLIYPFLKVSENRPPPCVCCMGRQDSDQNVSNLQMNSNGAIVSQPSDIQIQEDIQSNITFIN